MIVLGERIAVEGRYETACIATQPERNRLLTTGYEGS